MGLLCFLLAEVDGVTACLDGRQPGETDVEQKLFHWRHCVGNMRRSTASSQSHSLNISRPSSCSLLGLAVLT
jgi:hypothetical protein